ncbi:MAG: hypothetical protein NZ749_10105 [bacterium]|nr:hypothetical protein [bacterium]
MMKHWLVVTVPMLLLACSAHPLRQNLLSQTAREDSLQSSEADGGGQQWYEIRTHLDYRPNKSCEVRVVFRRDVWTDIHFYFYDSDRSQPVLYTRHRGVGYLLDVSAVPDPLNPEQELLLFYTAAQYPVGHLWRIDHEKRTIQRVLEGTYLDTAYLVTKRLVSEWKPAHYVLAEGRYDFQLMAKRFWVWDDKRRRFIPSWWRVEEPTYRFFRWMDELTGQFDKLGTPCAPPEPVPTQRIAKFDYYTFWLKASVDGSVKPYHLQVAYNGDEAYLSIYQPSDRGSKLLRCTKLEELGWVIAVRAVPDPERPLRSLVAVYDESGRCIVWRINAKTLRPVVVMEGYFLDLSQIGKGIVKEWTQALSLVKDAGWDAYPAAFRDPKAMAYRVWRWDKCKQQFVVTSAWRIGKWSRENYRRFGFWE